MRNLVSNLIVVCLSFGLVHCGSSDADPQSGANSSSYECNGPGERFASLVQEVKFGAGQNFGQNQFPNVVFGPPQGGGCCTGSSHVVSLGEGGSVTLGFQGNVIIDGEGTDFTVFENAFQPAGGAPESVFAELGTVSVSKDGQNFFTFPCTASSYPFGQCAGYRPVLANAQENAIDPLDPSQSGGDLFDLAEVGLDWARYVRIEDRNDSEKVSEGTFDLDAIGIIHPGCPQ